MPVSVEDNTRIVRDIHLLWNDREFDRILSEMIAEDIEWITVPTGQTFRGHEGFREFMQGWADAFPDGRTEDTTAYAGEEFGVSEFIGRGTHDGPLRSPAGESRRRAVRWSSGCARCTNSEMARLSAGTITLTLWG
jgi:ketosteroid isomerase-like protein